MRLQRRGMAGRAWVPSPRPHLRPRARWAPPGHSPPADATLAVEYLFERFTDASLPSLWRDNASYSGGTASTTGNGLEMDPAPGRWSEVIARLPIDLAGRSVTFEWVIDAEFLLYKESFAEIALVDAATNFIYDIWMIYHVPSSTLRGHVAGATLSYFAVTTDASDWRYIRIDSDPADPGQVTVYRSADRRTWTTVGTDTIDPADLGSLYLYAYTSGAYWLPVPYSTTFDNLTGWTTTGDAVISSNRLALGGTTGAGTADKALSFDFTDAEINVEAWPDPTNTGDAVWTMEAYRNDDGEYFRIVVDVAADEIRWETSLVNGVWQADYDATAMRFLSMVAATYSGPVLRLSATGAFATWSDTYIGSSTWYTTSVQGGVVTGFDGIRFTFTSTVATDRWYVDNLNTQR